jgi:hypothetical protein
MCELANPQKRRDDVDNDGSNCDRDFHDGVELLNCISFGLEGFMNFVQ